MSDFELVDLGKRRDAKRIKPEDALEAFAELLKSGEFRPDHLVIVAHDESGEVERFALHGTSNTTNKDALWLLTRAINLMMEPTDE